MFCSYAMCFFFKDKRTDNSLAMNKQYVTITPSSVQQDNLPEQMLLETHAGFEAILEVTTDLVLTVNRTCNIIYANPAAVSSTGYAQDEIMGRGIVDLFTLPSQELIADKFSILLEKGAHRQELELVCKNKAIMNVDCAVSSIYDRDGEVGLFVFSLRDITDGKRDEIELRNANELLRAREQELKAMNLQLHAHEQQLRAANQQLSAANQQLIASQKEIRESNEFLENIFETSADGIMVTDSRGYICKANAAVGEMLGYRENELIGKNTLELGPYDETYIQEKLSRSEAFLQQRPVRNWETKWQRKDGSQCPVEINMSFIKDQHDTITEVVGLIRDISQRKWAEMALHESEEEYRTLVENLNVGIYRNTGTDNGRFIKANPGMIKIFGYDSVEEFLKISVTDLYEKAVDRRLFLEELMQHGVVKGKELRLKKKDGTFIWVSCSASVKFDHDDTIKWIDGIIEDISERKQTEDQLRQAQKMEAIGTLAGGIAHDFNNILTAIMGYTELSFDMVDKKGPVYRNLQQVLSGAERAKDLVMQILTFSRRTEQETRPVSIQPIIKETVKFLRATLPTTIEIRQRIKAETDIIMCDPTQVHQLLMNLCTNAKHAMQDKGGLLEIGLAEESVQENDAALSPGQYLKLAVRDTGCGMKKQVLERIFDPFYTTKEQGEGTGLGLSVVHGIVKSCGGDIRISTKPGAGTTFNIYFPKAEPAVYKEKMLPVTEI